MKHLSTLLLVLAFATPSLRAQDLRAYRQQQLREALQEKLKVDLHALKSKGTAVLSQPAATPKSSGILSTSESPVSVVSTPEAEVHAAINPTDTNNIVVSPMQLTSGSLVMPIYYTRDFGKSWKKSSFRPGPYESSALVLGGGDPLFAFDADGTLYMSWIDLYANSTLDSLYSGTYWAYSTNGGQSWVRPKDAYVGSSRSKLDLGNPEPDSTFALDDKEWLTVDRSNSEYHGNMYVAWTRIGNNHYGVYLRRKVAHEDTLRPPVLVSQGNYLEVQYTSIGVDHSGRVHVTFMGSKDGNTMAMYHAYSADGGATFQPEEKVANIDVPGASLDARDYTIYGIRSPGNYPCPHLAIDTAASGNMYLVWNALGTTDNLGHGTDIYFSRWSVQSGSWSEPSVINNDSQSDPIDHFYPSIAVNSLGVLTVTWYDRREDPLNESARLYMAQSFDFGATWTNVPVAAESTDFGTVGDQNGQFGIGEYNQVLTTNGYAIPVWVDGRKGDGDLDIYAAFLPISKDGLSVGSRLETVRALVDNIKLFPSPAGSAVHTNFDLRETAEAQVTVVNQIGQTVKTLSSGELTAGPHSVDLDVSALANGTYYFVVKTISGVEETPFVVSH